MNDIGVGCAQREINGLLKLLNSRRIEKVNELNEIATTQNIEIIRNTYRSYERRSPDNFEIVASLAAIGGIVDEAQIIHAIKTQIDFLKTWMDLKKSKSTIIQYFGYLNYNFAGK